MSKNKIFEPNEDNSEVNEEPFRKTKDKFTDYPSRNPQLSVVTISDYELKESSKESIVQTSQLDQ